MNAKYKPGDLIGFRYDDPGGYGGQRIFLVKEVQPTYNARPYYLCDTFVRIEVDGGYAWELTVTRPIDLEAPDRPGEYTTKIDDPNLATMLLLKSRDKD